jgi:ABC-type thiamine transport system ATPase subunit
VAFVNILVEVFDNRDGGADLHIDVSVEEQGHVRVVGHHSAVVKGKSTLVTVVAKQQLLHERCHRSINASMAA